MVRFTSVTFGTFLAGTAGIVKEKFKLFNYNREQNRSILSILKL